MLKIILADSQAIFRAGAAKVLAVEDDFRIVAQCENSDRMMVAVESFRANVLVFSTAMRVDVRKLVDACKVTKTRLVIVIESSDNSAQYLQLGIGGVVFRNVSGTALVECVRKVARGETWVQDAGAAAEATENDIVGARVRDRLTPKELKIVALIVQGFKNKEIANQLGTTEQVIKNYLRNVYDKIGVSDRLELALFTIHHRILAEAAAALAGTANQMSN
ncbi:MAG TPA: response regulator transcription factor [Terriglobales bacterium]|nr:response regulator transcription factor [Terriglobales bacterium]